VSSLSTWCHAKQRAVRLDVCGNCKVGHRRIAGIHVPTQRKGMIPATPCDRIVAVRINSWTIGPWYVYVDGALLRTPRGEPRRYSSEGRALAAGRRCSPNEN
jgi:hypothetical protein